MVVDICSTYVNMLQSFFEVNSQKERVIEHELFFCSLINNTNILEYFCTIRLHLTVKTLHKY